MEDEGALWRGYFQQPHSKGGSLLQLMSNVGERVTMPFLSEGHGRSYAHPECGIPDPFPSKRYIFPSKSIPDLPSMPIDCARDIWYHNNGESGKMLHVMSGNHHHYSNRYGALPSEGTVAAMGNNAHTLEMLQLVDPLKEQNVAVREDAGVPPLNVTPLHKRSKGQARPFSKELKPKRTKKANAPKQESAKSSGKGRSAKKSLDMVINGIELDLSGIPAPLCTCTGQPQQCYRWGAGGWQSACCTTSISTYPLPMSTKRRGARISGRKMSQGAFKKVLEKLAGEGQDFSSPINLKPFWAKHGTNKFVTIR